MRKIHAAKLKACTTLGWKLWFLGNSLAAQWLGFYCRGAWVLSLVGELRSGIPYATVGGKKERERELEDSGGTRS